MKREVVLAAATFHVPVMDNLEIDWAQEQRKDPSLMRMIDCLESKVEMKSAEKKRLLDYYMSNGVLHHKYRDPTLRSMGSYLAQRVVPKHLQARLVDVVHKGYPQAHLGVDATYWKLKQNFFFGQQCTPK